MFMNLKYLWGLGIASRISKSFVVLQSIFGGVPLNNTLHVAAGLIYHIYYYLCGIIYLSHERTLLATL